MAQQETTAPTRQIDGRHDFDFLFGRWRIANRKLEDPLADGSTRWLEFPASSECRPILRGLGNVDTYAAPELPGRGDFHGCGFRLFDCDADVWRIWWASTIGGGLLDPPVVGRFQDGSGRFDCDDTIGGRDLTVRYDWTDITPSSARWQQSFSFDGGLTFDPNWIMELTRIG
ncbi:MAG TPA: hypothetical protein VFO03_00425 [Gaiellaceae bacterium]|nr:hypothetical protein [Gaiellaceae bacterium]